MSDATPTLDPYDPYWNSTALFPAKYAGQIPIPLSVSEWSGGEWATVVVGSALTGITLLLTCWILYDRNYRPLKAIQVPLFSLAMLSGYCYWFGDLAQQRVLPQTGALTGAGCTVIGIWLQFVFGLSLFLSVVCFRFLRLFRIVYQRKTAHSFAFQSIIVVLWAPSVIIAIAASATEANGPLHTRGLELCYFSTTFFYLFCFYYLALVLAGLLAKVRARIFNEYREHCVLAVVYILTIMIYGIVDALDLQFTPWGRSLITFLVLNTVIMYFVVVAGRPVFDSIFDRQAAMTRFENLINGKIVFDSDINSKTSVSRSAFNTSTRTVRSMFTSSKIDLTTETSSTAGGNDASEMIPAGNPPV